MASLPVPQFRMPPIASVLHFAKKDVVEAVREIKPDVVLSKAVEDLVDELFARFRIEEISLDWEQRTSSGATDTVISVGEQPGLWGDGPVDVEGSRIAMVVPFTGESRLFGFQPSTFTSAPPRFDVHPGKIVIPYEATYPIDPAAAKQYFDDLFTDIEKHLAWQHDDIEPWNQQLRPMLREMVEERRAKVLADHQLDAFLNVPIIGRSNPTPILAVDPVKRAPLAPAPQPTSLPFEPEPGITPAAFEGILTSIEGVNSVIERLPRTFNGMPEESIRDILLAVLSNQYGPASGETFSRKGKTDILIPYEGDAGAVFIAECKWWTGPKAFGKAIDQLLGYLTWRDTHASLIVFVRKGSPTDIKTKAVKELENNAAFKRTVERHGRQLFTLANATDAARELHVALLIIPVLA